MPATLLTAVLAAHVYGPHEFRAGMRGDRAVSNLDYYRQNYPALTQRISRGVNFPALVLNYPFRNAFQPLLYSRNGEYTYFSIYPSDLSFFIFVTTFWYCLGRRLDRVPGVIREDRLLSVRAAGPVFGLLFGILSGAYADQMAGSQFRPDRQVGYIGLAWSVGLTAYFFWRLTRLRKMKSPTG